MSAAPRKRLVVLISGGGSNLQAFIDAAADPAYPCEVVAVISNRAGVFGLERAARAGIPAEVLDHTAFASRDAFDAALADSIDAYAPDLGPKASALIAEMMDEQKRALMDDLLAGPVVDAVHASGDDAECGIVECVEQAKDAKVCRGEHVGAPLSDDAPGAPSARLRARRQSLRCRAEAYWQLAPGPERQATMLHRDRTRIA